MGVHIHTKNVDQYVTIGGQVIGPLSTFHLSARIPPKFAHVTARRKFFKRGKWHYISVMCDRIAINSRLSLAAKYSWLLATSKYGRSLVKLGIWFPLEPSICFRAETLDSPIWYIKINNFCIFQCIWLYFGTLLESQVFIFMELNLLEFPDNLISLTCCWFYQSPKRCEQEVSRQSTFSAVPSTRSVVQNQFRASASTERMTHDNFTQNLPIEHKPKIDRLLMLQTLLHHLSHPSWR